MLLYNRKHKMRIGLLIRILLFLENLFKIRSCV